MTRIHRYIEQVEGQRRKQLALVIIEGEEEWKIKRILNKQRKRQVFGKIERVHSRI